MTYYILSTSTAVAEFIVQVTVSSGHIVSSNTYIFHAEEIIKPCTVTYSLQLFHQIVKGPWLIPSAQHIFYGRPME